MLGAFRTVAALRQLQRQLRPSITHHVALQATVLGSLAVVGYPGARVQRINRPWLSLHIERFRRALCAPVVSSLLWFLNNRLNTVALVENPDDYEMLLRLGITRPHLHLILGSGVDTELFRQLHEPTGSVTIAFVGRLLDDKGVRTLLTAHRMLRERGSDVELLIAGMPDPANPSSIPAEEAAGWNQEPDVSWLGNVRDIGALWARAHIAVLPSRREGLPMSLLEAAASGRAMIATDVPGCREVVRPGETGLLVPVDDAHALASAIDVLAANPELRRRFGQAARHLVVERFSSVIIGQQTVDLYRSLTNGDYLTERDLQGRLIWPVTKSAKKYWPWRPSPGPR